MALAVSRGTRILLLAGTLLGATVGLVAVEPTCTPLFGEVSWDCEMSLLGRSFSPLAGVLLVAVLAAALGAALGYLSGLLLDAVRRRHG